jgi:hypothetical protein
VVVVVLVPAGPAGVAPAVTPPWACGERYTVAPTVAVKLLDVAPVVVAPVGANASESIVMSRPRTKIELLAT